MNGINDDVYYIWLSLAMGSKNPHSLELLTEFSNIGELYECDDYSRLKLPEKLEEKLMDKDLTKSIEIIEKCSDLGIGIMSYGSELFPQRMKLLRTVPPVLYYKGSPIDYNKEVCITFVGTRRPSGRGRYNAEQLAFGCARCGFIVVSGLAKGIDRACHCGALLANRHTVGFSGVAIDKIFPSSNRDLYEAMFKNGCIFSEYAPGTVTDRYSFPERNRLMSAFSLGVVVVEAPSRSGSLITAEIGSELGKKIFAMPGDISITRGTNNLIAEGAIVVQSYKDVVNEYIGLYEGTINYVRDLDEAFPLVLKILSSKSIKKEVKETVRLVIDDDRENGEKAEVKEETPEKEQTAEENYSEDEKTVVSLLKKHKRLSLEDIISYSENSFDQVVNAITMLEINGKIARDENGLYMLS